MYMKNIILLTRFMKTGLGQCGICIALLSSLVSFRSHGLGGNTKRKGKISIPNPILNEVCLDKASYYHLGSSLRRKNRFL
jgi:hypothetical protein